MLVKDIVKTKYSGECKMDPDDLPVTVDDEEKQEVITYFVLYGVTEVYPLKEGAQLAHVPGISGKVYSKVLNSQLLEKQLPDFIKQEKPDLIATLQERLRTVQENNAKSKNKMSDATKNAAQKIREKKLSIKNEEKNINSYKSRLSHAISEKDNYYYARVTQSDGNMIWASPVFVRFTS